jgi:Thioredoxin
MAPASSPRCSSSRGAPSWMVYTAFALVAALALALAYQFLVRPTFLAASAASRERERFEEAPERELVYVYMNGCGWCQRFTPVWDAFEAKHGAALAKGANLKLVKYEAGAPEAGAYKVEGYPTVLLDVGDGRHVVFGGERSEKGLLAFLADNGISEGGKEGFFAAAERLDATPQYAKDAGAAMKAGGPSKEKRDSLANGAGGIKK